MKTEKNYSTMGKLLIFNSVWMGECRGLQGARNCKCVLVYRCVSLLDSLNSLCTFVIVNNVQCSKQRTPRERKLSPDASSVSGQEDARLIEFSSPVVKMAQVFAAKVLQILDS